MYGENLEVTLGERGWFVDRCRLFVTGPSPKLFRHCSPLSFLFLESLRLCCFTLSVGLFSYLDEGVCGEKFEDELGVMYDLQSSFFFLIISSKRVSMGLTVRRKTAKNLAVRRKNERILAVSRKKN